MNILLNQFSYFGFFQAILLLLIFAFSAKHRENTNAYLIILVGVLLIGLSGRVFSIAGLFEGYTRWSSLSEFAIMFFGPTVYLFTLSLITKKGITKRDFVHYIPGVFYSLMITLYYLLPAAEVINQRVVSGELFRVVRILVGTGLVVNITYYGLSVAQYVNFKNDLQNELSYDIKLKFLHNFLIAMGTCLLAWLIIYLLSFTSLEGLERQLRPFVWTAIALIILFITYYHMVSPEVLQYSKLLPANKYAQSKFSITDLDNLKLELEQIMENQKPFLNQKLLKAELADLLGISNPELARLLNERIGMNFFEYVNYYRIQEFIRLSQSEDAAVYTFFGMAQEAGFNSKATFNKSFKRIMGCSPTAYLRK